MKHLVATLFGLMLVMSVSAQDGKYLETSKETLTRQADTKTIIMKAHGYTAGERAELARTLPSSKFIVDASSSMQDGQPVIVLTMVRKARQGEVLQALKLNGVPRVVYDGIDHQLIK